MATPHKGCLYLYSLQERSWWIDIMWNVNLQILGRSSEILGGTPVFEQIEQIHEIGQIHQQSNNYSVGTARQRNSEWICQICEINLRTKIEFGTHWKSFNMI